MSAQEGSGGDATACVNRLSIQIIKAAVWWLWRLVSEECVGLDDITFHPEHEMG